MVTKTEARMAIMQETTAQMAELLAGKDPGIQSAILADLLAMYLAGHLIPEQREMVLEAHLRLVRDLIPVNEKIIRDRTN